VKTCKCILIIIIIIKQLSIPFLRIFYLILHLNYNHIKKIITDLN